MSNEIIHSAGGSCGASRKVLHHVLLLCKCARRVSAPKYHNETASKGLILNSNTRPSGFVKVQMSLTFLAKGKDFLQVFPAAPE